MGGLGDGGFGGSGPACQGAILVQTDSTSLNDHDHIPDVVQERATFFVTLTEHINGNNATTALTLPSENNHVHTITLTADQVNTLRAGGTVTGIVSSNVFNHTHTYTVSCA
jgi:hypothetical protein